MDDLLLSTTRLASDTGKGSLKWGPPSSECLVDAYIFHMSVTATRLPTTLDPKTVARDPGRDVVYWREANGSWSLNTLTCAKSVISLCLSL